MNPSVGANAAPLGGLEGPIMFGHDRFQTQRGLGVSELFFKIGGQDTQEIFIVENVFHARGGPAKHLHTDQDEWFYILEGDFVFEIGEHRYRLSPGDSLFAPRQVPHVWAFIGEARGRVLITFTPAGSMEAFFTNVTQVNAMPPQDPMLWRAHGMELLGAPLKVD